MRQYDLQTIIYLRIIWYVAKVQDMAKDSVKTCTLHFVSLYRMFSRANICWILKILPLLFVNDDNVDEGKQGKEIRHQAIKHRLGETDDKDAL
jgi:hypothetical protein